MKTTPIALVARDRVALWLRLAEPGPLIVRRVGRIAEEDRGGVISDRPVSADARDVRDALARRGASFFHDLVKESGLLPTRVERALGELVSDGTVHADGFGGLRALTTPSDKRKPLGAAGAASRRRTVPDGVETAGRWSLLRPSESPTGADAAIELQAMILLRRYGVVFRRVLMREENLAPWRELTRVYRRLEARGEIRGGRFVAGMPGEQFALAEAVGSLRATRRAAPSGALVAVSGVDPLNLAGYVTSGDTVAALTANRIVYRDGVPLAARDATGIHPLTDYPSATARQIEQALVRRPKTVTGPDSASRAG